MANIPCVGPGIYSKIVDAMPERNARQTMKPDELLKLAQKAVEATRKGYRVEWSMDKDGNIRVQTVSRKLLK